MLPSFVATLWNTVKAEGYPWRHNFWTLFLKNEIFFFFENFNRYWKTLAFHRWVTSGPTCKRLRGLVATWLPQVSYLRTRSAVGDGAEHPGAMSRGVRYPTPWMRVRLVLVVSGLPRILVRVSPIGTVRVCGYRVGLLTSAITERCADGGFREICDLDELTMDATAYPHPRDFTRSFVLTFLLLQFLFFSQNFSNRQLHQRQSLTSRDQV